MSILDFISSVAWPVSVLVIALLFREPLIEALRSATGKVAAGPFSIEWDKQVEEVEADLRRTPPLLAGGETSAAAEKLAEIASISPQAAIVEGFAQIEASLRTALENASIEIPPRSWSAYELSRLALENNLISAGTKEAIDGLRVLRNLAAHGQADDISPQRAQEFLTLTEASLANGPPIRQSVGHGTGRSQGSSATARHTASRTETARSERNREIRWRGLSTSGRRNPFGARSDSLVWSGRERGCQSRRGASGSRCDDGRVNHQRRSDRRGPPIEPAAP